MNLLTFFAPLAFIALIGTSSAALVVGLPIPITHEVRVQGIIVSEDDGTNTATYLGTLVQEGQIETLVDEIWSQAGIDITFLPTVDYNSTFALLGTSDPRPTSDLNTIVSQARSDGILHPDVRVINMFFVKNPAGFSTGLSANTAAGLAFVGGNGITQYIGANLPGFSGGRDSAASVISHEIGHNLGLHHLVEAENLMQPGGSSDPGARFNASQITTAHNSNFSAMIVPEPSSLILSMVGAITLVSRRRR